MRLLNVKTLKLESHSEKTAPPYAILSHTHDGDEVTFEDITSGRVGAANSRGWQKLLSAASKARHEGFDYIWIDTACIDHSSSAELSEAINSCFRWYQAADVCYAHLSDVSFSSTGSDDSSWASSSSLSLSIPTPQSPGAGPDGRSNGNGYMNGQGHGTSANGQPATNGQHTNGAGGHPDSTTGTSFVSARWFTRGWTLMELIAPSEVVFFSSDWKEFGTRESLAEVISQITRIDIRVLRSPGAWRGYSLAQKMSWASRRRTYRLEDEAYSLLGLFGVTMPIIYGEGRRAFIRLQQEILKASDDQTILAWTGTESPASLTGMLAQSPAEFRKCAGLSQSRTHEDETESRKNFFDKPIMAYDIAKGFVKLDVPVLGPFSGDKDHVLETILRGRVNMRDGTVNWTKVIIALLPGCSKGEYYTGLLLQPSADAKGVFQRLHYPTLVSVLKAVRNTELLAQRTIYVRASAEAPLSYYPPRTPQGCIVRCRPSQSSGYEFFLALPKVDKKSLAEPLWHTEDSSGAEHSIRVNRPAPVGLIFKSFDSSALPYLLIVIDWSADKTAVAPHSFVGGLQELLSIFDQASKRLNLPAVTPGPMLRALDSENWVVVKSRRAPKYHNVNIFIGPREEMNT